MTRLFRALLLIPFAPLAFAQANLGFEDGVAGSPPPGWFAPANWSITEIRAGAECRTGKCAMLTRPAEPPPDSFGNLMQSLDAAPYAGKRVIYRAAVRVEGGEEADRAMLWFRVDLPERKMGFFDNMSDRPIRAPSDGGWQVFEIAGDVAAEAVKVNFGVMAHGKARVWIDDVSLEIVARVDEGPEVTAARQALVKIYARMDEAGNAGRWDDMLGFALPDAKAGNAAMKMPMRQMIEQMKKLVASGLKISGTNEVVSVSLAGAEATVSVRGMATMEKDGVPRQYAGTTRDIWVKQADGAWKLKDSTSVSQREVVAPLDAEGAKTVAAAIAAQAVPLRAVTAGGSRDDLAAFGKAVGGARIVSLGEASHGSREIFQMKHRLLEYLVKEKGFTVFAIEANWPEAQAADRYIKTGEGSAHAALRGMYFWTWQTEEVAAMIEWMREFNQQPGDHPILSFTAFDMQTWSVARDRVVEFARQHAPADLAAVEAAYRSLAEAPERVQSDPRFVAAETGAAEVVRLLESRREALAKATSESAWRDAVQMARIVTQAAGMRKPGASLSHRDEMMARNVEWLANEAFPGQKIVLWAHNGHVATSSPLDAAFKPMGVWLRSRLGPSMYVAGFAINAGTVRAVEAGKGLGAHDLPAAPVGSGSAVLSAVGQPVFFFDLKAAAARGGALGAWLSGRHNFRELGAMWSAGGAESNMRAESLAASYDGLIFIERTEAARAIPRP